MADQMKLIAEMREEFGKGAARRIRRADKIPAVMYGHGSAPVHITLPGHETLLAMRVANALVSVQIDGKDQLALAKQIQRDPIKGSIEHVDLVMVRRGEKVTVDVAVIPVGEAGPETVVVVDTQTVSLQVEATNIPESIEVSIEGMQAGSQILARDLALPTGAVFHGEEDTLIINITQQVSEEQLEAELAESESEIGIEREESESQAEGDQASSQESGDKGEDE